MADKYDFVRVVGKGSFGKAWLVKSKASQRQYVLKEIQVSNMSEKDRHQAVNEVAILARLKHKNIVRYREAFVATGTLNIVMAYADGGDLSHHIRQARTSETSLAESQIMSWFVQITFALVYIHDLKILHRDLKPQNIFLTSDNIVKLGDFGIARTLKNTQDRANTAIGTPYYISPEICRRLPYNHKSDIWAAGCVLYEMLTLHHPFEADDFSILVLKILRGKYKDIPRSYGPLPGDLVSVLLRVNPDRRPSSEQILSIPSIRSYVTEYTSRSRNASKISRSSCRSITSTSEDQESATVGDQARVRKSDGQSSKDDGQQIANAQEDDVFVANGTKDDDGRHLSSVSRSSNVAVNCARPTASVEKSKEIMIMKHRTDVATSDVKEKHDNNGANVQQKLCRQSCWYKVRNGSEEKPGSKMKAMSDQMKRKIKSSSDVAQEVTSPRWDENGIPDDRMFSKEGIKTVKRRKYSCMTPVAAKVVRGIGTPCSVKMANAKRLSRKSQCKEETPPVLKLFGNRKNGIALKDGWSPDISPRLTRTRVIRKANLMKGGFTKKHHDGQCKSIEQRIGRTASSSMSKERSKARDVPDHNKAVLVNEQPTSFILLNDEATSERMVPNSNETQQPSSAGVPMKQDGPHQYVETSANRTGADMIASSEYHEVCEMMLACTPDIPKNGRDNQARLELLKMYLERKLGSETAVVAHELIERLVLEGKDEGDVVKEVQRLLPPSQVVFTALLIHVRGLQAFCMQS